MKLNPKQIESVLALPGPKRYDHFIKVVADWESAWGLFQDGWALYGTDEEEQQVFPLWPAKEYAELCAVEDWGKFEPRAIPLVDLIDDLLPNLRNDDVLVAVFPTPTGKSIVVAADELLAHLRNELSKIE